MSWYQAEFLWFSFINYCQKFKTIFHLKTSGIWWIVTKKPTNNQKEPNKIFEFELCKPEKATIGRKTAGSEWEAISEEDDCPPIIIAKEVAAIGIDERIRNKCKDKKNF